MAIAAIIAKIMPDSPDEDLGAIQGQVEKTLKDNGGLNISIEQSPVAFGLSALMVKFAWPEEKGTDSVEDLLSVLEGVASVNIEDYRRAFG